MATATEPPGAHAYGVLSGLLFFQPGPHPAGDEPERAGAGEREARRGEGGPAAAPEDAAHVLVRGFLGSAHPNALQRAAITTSLS